MSFKLSSLVLAAALVAGSATAQTVSNVSFVNGLALSGSSTDLTGTGFDSRLGYFSDLYYDRGRNEWWALSDRGPGGGTLPYDTRVQRFTVDIAANGAISNFQVQQTVRFSAAGLALNGQAPSPSSQLGRAFDPEGFVINPRNGNFLVSDEYGPSLYEFNRQGELVRSFTTPANLLPRNAQGVANYASDAGNTLGKRTNRGFEGLAVTPDGRYAYAMLQSAMLDEGGGDGVYSRIVKFDLDTGASVGQFAYRMDTAARGRGISALVALDAEHLLVLERNNRGLGVGATLSGPEKLVYAIDLSGATDVSGLALPATGALPTGVNAVLKGDKVIDLGANTLAALGNKVPEKWEGLAIGPQLADGRYVILAGTDNDYSVTQNGSGVQFDVWMRMSDANPDGQAILCPVGQTTGCVFNSGGAPATLSNAYQLLPGVLQAYTANISGYTAPVPEPETYALLLAGLGCIGWAARRRRA
ncbi:MAG: esterase-like activity of phytase family protein [Aquabacterium sp.]|nr:esterase-like activity of phytase family protein [Aquabacterium sp.]